jgi:hypothetical protein
MRLFDQLVAKLAETPDPRRAEGKLYKLPYVLLFSILVVVTGGNSFRAVAAFITVHRRRLNAAFGLRRKRAPVRTAIRYILRASILLRSNRCSAVTPLACRTALAIRRAEPSHSMARRCGEVSITSPIARQPRCWTGRLASDRRPLVVPENRALLHSPPYSPELNPVENVWQYLRQNFLSNRVLASYNAIVDACCDAWNTLMALPDRIHSITQRDWVKTVST